MNGDDNIVDNDVDDDHKHRPLKLNKELSNNNNKCKDSSMIELEPFIHQVGGRSTILVFGKYICKPINERELLFYESIDVYAKKLKPFVPKFHGTISVNFQESDDGYMIMTTNARLLETSSTLRNSFSNNNNNDSNEKDNINKSNETLSPYQKFVTKYRIKLVRPIKEIIIESHEQLDFNDDQQQDVLSNLNDRLDSIVKNSNDNTKITDRNSNHGHSSTAISTTTPTPTSNLNRSRSTSISIPNFEDGNFNNSNDLSTLFDKQFVINEVGQNGFRDSNGSHNKNSSSLTTQSSNKKTSENNKHSAIGGSHFHSDHSQHNNYNHHNNHQQHTDPRLINSNHFSTTKHNPWVLKTFSVLSDFNESMKEQKFILLENLTSDFEYPCIMDLKMGTRLHDDFASKTKILSHESKVNETTSGVLGLRVTGIQIYDQELDKFICFNKYYGRKLTPETFRSTLKMFISNENFYNHHKLLEKMIERLKALRSVIIELNGFRFYTSSLLLIYEGNRCHCNDENEQSSQTTITDDGIDSNECEPMFDVRMIDFAHSTHPNLSTPTKSIKHDGYDDGFIYGLDNLIKILSLFHNEYYNNNNSKMQS